MKNKSILHSLLKRKKQTKPRSTIQEEFSLVLSTNVKENLQNIKQIMDSSSDLLTKEFKIGNSIHTCAIVCIDGLVNQNLVHDQIIKNIILGISEANKKIPVLAEDIVSQLEMEVLSSNEVEKVNTLDAVMLGVLDGDTALFVDGTDQVLIIGSKGWSERAVEEPQSESLIRGPRDGFTENINTNIAQIRRRLRDPNLRFHTYRIGRRAKKIVIIAHIAGITHPKLVKEVKRRLKTVDMDDAEGSGFIEQWIADSFLSPFPLILSTERPDKSSAALLEGRVVILVDGTPFALVLPITIASVFQSPEDYYSNWLISTLIRMLRSVAAFIATFAPALYIALVEYHHGLIPSKLAFSIAGTREGVPFPAVIEAFIMEATLEILREAGIRLPKPIGQTIGIVGGLVIGEAAVQAGVVSPIMVIVVSLTAITSFALPSYAFAMSLRTIRFAIMLSAAFFGLYGVIMAYIMINIHIVNLKSFGIPYSAPFSPSFFNDWKDVILRAPVNMLDKRPQMMQAEDKDRMDK